MTSPDPAAAPRAADPTRFRLLRPQPDGTVRRGGLELLEGLGPVWIDLTHPEEAELALIGARFNLHPLALEDCAHLDQRPKLEEYGDYLFLVQHSFSCGARPHDLALHELHAFLSRDFLITVHDDATPELEDVLARAAADGQLFARGLDFLLYLVSDRIAERHFLVTDAIAEAVEALEDEILTRASRSTIEELFALKRALVVLRKTLSPARDVMALLSRRGDPRIGERSAVYFRDVYDHLVRTNEAIEADRDLLGNALDAYLSMAANRTNEIVKQLTIFSVTFLPLSFITGFFGQNFAAMPFDSRWLFGTMLGLCVAVPTGMLAWFTRKQWM